MLFARAAYTSYGQQVSHQGAEKPELKANRCATLVGPPLRGFESIAGRRPCGLGGTLERDCYMSVDRARDTERLRRCRLDEGLAFWKARK